MLPNDPRQRATYFRKRAVFLLADITGIDPLDPRLVELVECIEAAAVAVVERRRTEKTAS